MSRWRRSHLRERWRREDDVGREHAVVASQMGEWRRNERCEATQEVDHGERELGPAIVQGTLERKNHASAGIDREPRAGDR